MKTENTTTTKAPVAPTTSAPKAPEVTTTSAPVTTLAPEVSLSAMTDDINELTNPTKTETETKTETKEVEVVEIERRRTKKVEIMEPMNTDFPIYNEPKRR